MKINTKLRLALLLIALIIAAVVALNYHNSATALTEKVHQHLESVATLQGHNVASIMARDRERRRQIAAERQVREALEEFIDSPLENNRDRLNQILQDIASSGSDLRQFDVLDQENSMCVASSNLQAIGGTIQLHTYFPDRTGGKGGEYFDLGKDNVLQIRRFEPILSDDGEVMGNLLVHSSGESILSAIRHHSTLDRSLETLVGKRSKESGGALLLTPLKFADDRPLPVVIPPEQGDAPMIRALHGEVGFMEDGNDYRGEPVLASTHFYDDFGLGLVVKIDRAEAFAPLRRLRNLSLITGAAGLAGLAFIFIGIGRKITRPVINLSETASRILHGDLTRRAEIGSSDETGTLARNFNEMAEKLIEANSGLERKVRERTAELERSNAELQQFAYVASHDLQEPLRMVASYVQLLEKRYKGQLDEDADEFIHFAVDGAKRMQRLVRDLLAYSRVGTKARPFEPTDCNEILKTAKQNLKIAIEEAGGQVVVEELPTIEADPTQLGQLFQNLIGNGLKFRGDKKPVVTVSAAPEGENWVFRVQDNGIGIDPAHVDRIFLIFQRLHGRDEYEGTGIGLAVCKKIVERHGGEIHVESAVGEGTTFVFTMPQHRPDFGSTQELVL